MEIFFQEFIFVKYQIFFRKIYIIIIQEILSFKIQIQFLDMTILKMYEYRKS